MSVTKTTNAQGNRVEYDYGNKYSEPRSGDGRKNGDKKRGWQVGEMYESHHEVARRILIGQKNVDIAADMNLSDVQVSSIRNSPVVQDRLAIMAAARDCETLDIAADIMKMAPIALKRIKEALDTGQVNGLPCSPTTILKESNNILDRQIGKPTQTINTRNIHGHFTVDDMAQIKAKARELAMESGQLAADI